MNRTDLADLRKEYAREQLTRRSVQDDPLLQFSAWFDEAMGAQLLEPAAMTLSTADEHGYVTSRIVLLKGITPDGFVFYTNYASQKGQQLEVNPQASLLFFWPELERQVRVTGTVRRVPAETSWHQRSHPRNPMPTSHRGLLKAGSVPRPPPRAPYCHRATSWKLQRRNCVSATPTVTCHVRSGGVATCSRPLPSSSGRGVHRGYTIVSAIDAMEISGTWID